MGGCSHTVVAARQWRSRFARLTAPARPDCIYPRPIFQAASIDCMHDSACMRVRASIAASVCMHAALQHARNILPCPQRSQLNTAYAPRVLRPPAAAMSHARPAARRRAVSAPALLCTHMVYEPEYCFECEMWLRGGRQYWEHLQSRRHKKRRRRRRGHRRSSSCPATLEHFSAGVGR